MQIIDHVEYVKDLQIQAPVAGFPSLKGGAPVIEGVEQSFLNARSLVSFVSEIDGQRRNDVLNSILIAQLAANKQFPDELQILDWYKAFINVLNNLGWTIEAAEFSSFRSDSDVFEVENAIIDILTSAFGEVFKTVIIKTLASIKGLGDANGKITAFEKNTHSLSKGAFQIGLAKEENGVVVIQLGTFMLTSSSQIKRILFFKSTKDKTTLQYCSRKGTLNEEVYANIRKPVLDKLAGKATEFIAEVEID